ncbi:MAG: hypothetical protein ACUVV3_06955 [Dehalococcoidia bacterium]
MLARVIEATGISTVMVTMMPDLAERVGVPRAVGVEFPFGHTLGHAGDREEQMKVIGDALRVLRDARQPNTVEHLPYQWPDVERWKQEWHPKEPSPIIAFLAEQRRRARAAE